jgi:hypothetical protein
MSDQVEKKLQHVAIASYEYRHDAEFAAGFLDDAGIPYRLQVDDPALGISVGVSATIWVREMDAARAREILEVEDGGRALSQRTPSQREIEARRRKMATRAAREPLASRPLDGRERVMSFLFSAGALGIGASAMESGVGGEAAVYGAIAAAAILALVGIVGRAPRMIRRLLSVFSGNAP